MHNKLIILMAKISVLFVLSVISFGFTEVYAARPHKAPIVSKKVSSNASATSAPMLKPVADLVVAASPDNGAIPQSPDFDVKSYVLIDANSGYVIAEKNPGLRASPASLTKVMTLYLVANALREGKIHLNDQITVSENAWRTGGSRMFIRVGTNVAIEDLIKGIAVASGNDATVAMAEHLAGSEQNFVVSMNQVVHNLKMDNSNFSDSSGLPHENNYSTASDLAVLARAWILNFPEYYPWFKERWILYNGIKQPNRNRLLWRDSSVDGMKTGHTDDAGYCLITSAMRGNMRLIAVVMGAKSDGARANNSIALLNYGFRFFESRKLFAANANVVTPKVRLGKEKIASLGLTEDLYITLPIGQYKKIKANVVLTSHLKAPIVKGNSYGIINVLLDNKVIATKTLVALKDNPRANFLFVMFDYVLSLFGG